MKDTRIDTEDIEAPLEGDGSRVFAREGARRATIIWESFRVQLPCDDFIARVLVRPRLV